MCRWLPWVLLSATREQQCRHRPPSVWSSALKQLILTYAIIQQCNASSRQKNSNHITIKWHLQRLVHAIATSSRKHTANRKDTFNICLRCRTCDQICSQISQFAVFLALRCSERQHIVIIYPLWHGFRCARPIKWKLEMWSIYEQSNSKIFFLEFAFRLYKSVD